MALESDIRPLEPKYKRRAQCLGWIGIIFIIAAWILIQAGGAIYAILPTILFLASWATAIMYSRK